MDYLHTMSDHWSKTPESVTTEAAHSPMACFCRMFDHTATLLDCVNKVNFESRMKHATNLVVLVIEKP